jgi:hypothetical protein
MISRSVKAEAIDPKAGMTLDELAAYIAECQEAEVPGNVRVRVRVNVRGGIKAVETRG